MPLNPERGEVVEGLGKLFRVVPKEKWAGTPLFEEARVAAHEAFRRTAGKFVNDRTPPIGLDCGNFIVQEYPFTDTLAFIFSAVIGGQEHYYPYTFKLDRGMTSRLNAEGMWSFGLPNKRKGTAF